MEPHQALSISVSARNSVHVEPILILDSAKKHFACQMPSTMALLLFRNADRLHTGEAADVGLAPKTMRCHPPPPARPFS